MKKTKKRRYINITLAEILHILCILAIIISFSMYFSTAAKDLQELKPNIAKVNNALQENPKNNTVEEEMEQGIAQMKSFFTKMVFGIFMISIIVIALTTLTKGFIYSRYSDLGFKKFLKGFAKINVAWMVGWAFIIGLTFKLFQVYIFPFVFIFEIIIYLLLTPLYRTAYLKNKVSFKKFISYIGQIQLYIIPVTVVLVLAVLNIFIWILIAIKPGFIQIILNSVFLLFISVWGRNFLVRSAGVK